VNPGNFGIMLKLARFIRCDRNAPGRTVGHLESDATAAQSAPLSHDLLKFVALYSVTGRTRLRLQSQTLVANARLKSKTARDCRPHEVIKSITGDRNARRGDRMRRHEFITPFGNMVVRVARRNNDVLRQWQ
jgi:hypothetical protein